jgi:uncharacterized protein (DUF1697 family)
LTAGGRVAVFLRAVNLAGRRLTMADFKRALAAAGYDEAETVAATGNAVIRAPAPRGRAGLGGGGLARLEAAVEQALAKTLGQATEVFARDAAELAAIVAGNPFADFAQADPSHMVVVLLRQAPEPALVEALRARIKGREEVAAGPRALYATFPDDIGHSKLTAAVIERALKDRGTARNWNTLRRMADLTAAP